MVLICAFLICTTCKFKITIQATESEASAAITKLLPFSANIRSSRPHIVPSWLLALLEWTGPGPFGGRSLLLAWGPVHPVSWSHPVGAVKGRGLSFMFCPFWSVHFTGWILTSVLSRGFSKSLVTVL